MTGVLKYLAGTLWPWHTIVTVRSRGHDFASAGAKLGETSPFVGNGGRGGKVAAAMNRTRNENCHRRCQRNFRNQSAGLARSEILFFQHLPRLIFNGLRARVVPCPSLHSMFGLSATSVLPVHGRMDRGWFGVATPVSPRSFPNGSDPPGFQPSPSQALCYQPAASVSCPAPGSSGSSRPPLYPWR